MTNRFQSTPWIFRVFPIIASALALAACAPNPANAESSTPVRIAQVRHACAETMGLNASEQPFDLCVASLSQTLASLDQAALVDRDRRACADRGLQPGTPAFATCVVDAEQPTSN